MISVIIPYYNALQTIERTLDSLLFQTFRDFEIIIVNDFSDDNPSHILNIYIDKFSILNINLIYIPLNKNSGPSFARNIGWDVAKGDYIAFLDSDDVWHSQKLELCLKVILKESPDMLIHDSGLLRTGLLSEISKIYYPEKLLKAIEVPRYKWLIKNLAVTPAVLLRRNLDFRFDTNMKYCEDYDLFLRIAFSKAEVFKIESLPLCYLGKPFMTGGGLSSNVSKMRLGEIKMFIKFSFQDLKNIPLLPFLVMYSLLKYVRLLVNSKLIDKKSKGQFK